MPLCESPSPDRKRLRLRRRLVPGCLILLIGSFFGFRWCLGNFVMFPTRVSEFPAPSGLGAAVFFLLDGPDSTSVFCAKYPAPDGVHGEYVVVGEVGIEDIGEMPPLYADHFIWSKDGTVVALLNGRYFVCAYDFRDKRSILPQKDDSAQPQSVISQTRQLLEERGGFDHVPEEDEGTSLSFDQQRRYGKVILRSQFRSLWPVLQARLEGRTQEPFVWR